MPLAFAGSLLLQYEAACACRRTVCVQVHACITLRMLWSSCRDGHMVNIKYRGLEEKKFWQVGWGWFGRCGRHRRP